MESVQFNLVEEADSTACYTIVGRIDNKEVGHRFAAGFHGEDFILSDVIKTMPIQGFCTSRTKCDTDEIFAHLTGVID